MRFVHAVSVLGVLILSACAGAPAKLDASLVKANERVIVGRYLDLNPEGRDLELSYVLSKEAQNQFLSLDNKIPSVDRKSGYFWATLPATSSYIGIRSLHFGVKGRSGVAVIRDEKDHLPLFGMDVPPGKDPLYLGDIVIRSAVVETGKSFVGLPVEEFQLKEITVRDERASAQRFLESQGMASSAMTTQVFSVKDSKLLSVDVTIPKKFKN